MIVPSALFSPVLLSPVLLSPILSGQTPATSRVTALTLAARFIRAAGVPVSDLRAEVIAAEADAYVPGAYVRGESVWRITSERERIAVLVPYRAAYVARYDDGGMFSRSRRPDWSVAFPAPKARRLALLTLARLGVPTSWTAMPDTFSRPPGSRTVIWPHIAMTGRAERPGGFPVVGAGNAARVQLEPGTGAVRWFAQRRDLRCVPPARRIAPSAAQGIAGGGTASLVWDARDPERAPRLAYRVLRRAETVYVDAETGRRG